MVRFIGLRLAQSVVVLFGAIIISFVLTNISGDAAQARLGLFATPDQLAKARHELGIEPADDRRVVTYVGHAARGDFGNSFSRCRSRRSISFCTRCPGPSVSSPRR